MSALRALLAMLTIVPFVLLSGLALAQEGQPHSVELSGPNFQTVKLTTEVLAKLPTVEKEVTFKTSGGTSTGKFIGVLLWDIFQANKALDAFGHNKELLHTFLVVSADNYQIAFSIGEIAPDFGNAPIMLATAMDGKPIDKGFRIIVPGDTRGSRNVREVARIELK